MPPNAPRRLAALATAFLLIGRPVDAPQAPQLVQGLPLTLVPAQASGQAPGDAFAVLLSGDGGWAPFDRALANALARSGIPVVGWSARRYFQTPRTPGSAAGDLWRVIESSGSALGRRRVLLVGFSFGADALPFMIDRLPPPVRGRIAGVALIAPSATAQFRFSARDWLFPPAGGLAVAPAIAALTPLRTLCAYGVRDGASPCPRLPSAAVQIVARPGGHHLAGGGDPALVGPVVRLLGHARPPGPLRGGHLSLAEALTAVRNAVRAA